MKLNKLKMKKVKRLKLQEVLYLVDYLLSEEGTSESVKLDIAKHRKVSTREKAMSDLLTEIYKIVHPYTDCSNHSEWLENSYEMFRKIEEDMRISKRNSELKEMTT